MVWATLAASMLLGGAPSHLASDASDVEAAITGGTAYIPGEATVIGRLAEDRISLSPNGLFVAWPRSTPREAARGARARQDLVVTDLESGAAYEIAQSLSESWKASWGTGRKLWVILEPDDADSPRTLLTLQAGQPDSLKMSRLDPALYGEDLHLYPIPGQQGALLLGQKVTEQAGGALKEEWVLSRLDRDGRVLQTASHQRQTTGPRGYFFTPEAKSLVIKAVRKGGEQLQAQIGLDDLSLTLVPKGSVAEPAPPAAPPISLTRSGGWLTLEGQSGSARVTPAAGSAFLTSDLARLVYSAEGHLFIREIRTMTAEQLLNERYAKARASAERSARDVGRALRRAWAEAGMSYPDKSQALKILARYVRWDESLESLLVEFPGGPLPRGVDAARTPYGRITTLYGQAVIHLDGTVDWINARPGS